MSMILSIQTVLNAFKQWRASGESCFVAYAPGRVNLIGDHTDYNDGLAMPMIMDQAIYVATRSSSSDSHLLRSENYDEEVSYPIDQWPTVPRTHWASYVAGMIREIPPPTSIEMLIMGNVPLGAGLSSSAALEIATGLALEKLNGTSIPPLDLAKIGQKVEHKYIGVKCGIMDQIVSRVGRSRHALYLDCKTLKWEHIPIEYPDIRFVVMDSRVKRQLASSKYNERRGECQRALQQIQADDSTIESIRHIQMDHIKAISDPTLQKRIRHVLLENERVKNARSAILRSDWFELGKLLSASHISLRDDYQVSCKELDVMVDQAESYTEVYGARMMGGGFGGCTINLVLEKDADLIAKSLVSESRKKLNYPVTYYSVAKGTEAGIQYFG
ncbi:MAG: galactokinase [Bacteroidetes bacterium]|nr:galactokinase [Bacteroidota bacterium]